MSNPTLASFERKKAKILSDLAVPLSTYKDRSPKGSVDEGIRDLIEEINSIGGLVTTSSCAGRISVYLEGEKASQDVEDEQQSRLPAEQNEALEETSAPVEQKLQADGGANMKFNAPGGKGHGGRWLFVSHSPIGQAPANGQADPLYFHNLFGLEPQHADQTQLDIQTSRSTRFIRLQFEPLLLHIMCATLPHAFAPLSAGMSSGFRESGIQSLTCLAQPSTHHPIVGIRSLGLTLQTVIGYVETSTDATGQETTIARSLVTEKYLSIMVKEISKRYVENEHRRERFRQALLKGMAAPLPVMVNDADETGTSASRKPGHIKPRPEGWEDPAARAQRKREEGLRRREELMKSSAKQQDTTSGGEEQQDTTFIETKEDDTELLQSALFES